VWKWKCGSVESVESAILVREERMKEEERWKRVVRMSVDGCEGSEGSGVAVVAAEGESEGGREGGREKGRGGGR